MRNLDPEDFYQNPVPNGRQIVYGVLFDDNTGELSISEHIRKNLSSPYLISWWEDELLPFLKLDEHWCWLGKEETLIERLIIYGKANLERIS